LIRLLNELTALEEREGKGREGKGREGKGREGKGREEKGSVMRYWGDGYECYVRTKMFLL
jgi:hypothetical protein